MSTRKTASNTPAETTSRTEELQEIVEALLQARLEEIASSRSQPTDSRTYKLPQPDKFDGGSNADLDHFFTQIGIIFDDKPSDFPDDKSKVGYAIAHFQGRASQWLHPQLGQGEPPAWRTDFALFKEELKRTFGYSKNRFKDAYALSDLKQTGSVSSYGIQFRQLAVRVPWPEEQLAFQFYRGLKKPIRLEVNRSPQAEDMKLEELIALAVRVEKTLEDLESEPDPFPRRFSRPQKKDSPVDGPSVATHAPARPGAALPLPQRSAEQMREYRRKNNLCLYCGGEGHIIRHCPVRPNGLPRPARVSEAILAIDEPLGNEPTQLL